MPSDHKPVDLHLRQHFKNGVNVLIIDDHPLFREGLQFVLSDLCEGLSFKEAAGLSEISKASLKDVDLILLDLGIADSNGFESLLKLKALNPTGAIVIVSSDCEPELIRKCIEGGAAGFIPKTSQPKVLLAALRLILAGGVYLPPNSMDETGAQAADNHAQNNALPLLTPRQSVALLLASRGLPNKSIAYNMGIAEGTVKLHLSAAYKLLGVKNRTEAVYAISRTSLETMAISNKITQGQPTFRTGNQKPD